MLTGKSETYRSGTQMPTYDFYDTETDEYFEKMMSISAKEKFLSDNPHIHQVPSAPSIVSQAGRDNYSRTPSGFKDVLSKIADAFPDSPVGEKHHRKSIKEVRTERVVKEHVKRITDKIGNK